MLLFCSSPSPIFRSLTLASSPAAARALQLRYRNPFLMASLPHDSNGFPETQSTRKQDDRKDLEKDADDLIRKQLGDPPEKPLPGDCCGSGCVRCVWDIYFEELEIYNRKRAALEEPNGKPSS